MTAPQGVTPGPNPPQFDALDADTQVVTFNIGGNDIGFTGIAENCLSTSPIGHATARATYVHDGRDEISERIAETAPKVAAVIQGIRARAPQARIFAVNYAAIFPERGCARLLAAAARRATATSPTCARSRRSSTR